ncbi:Na+/H+ antiporter NhaC, partial [Bacillus sp. SIMBA_161]
GTDTNLFVHIRHMIYTTIPGMVIALGAYFFLGGQFAGNSVDSGNINTILASLEDNFVISPWLLLVPLAVIVLVMKKVPALPALGIGIVLGWLGHILVQGGSVAEAVNALHDGYVITSGNEVVDSLFNRGGIDSMMFVISLTIFAMT